MLWYVTTLYDTCLTVCEAVIYGSQQPRQRCSKDGYAEICARISACCDIFAVWAYLKKEILSPGIRQLVTTSYLFTYKPSLYIISDVKCLLEG